jgi:Raf kinase inhibitor-like YbhB/YbcL family protein
MVISSTAFKNMSPIPDEFTCNGDGTNPPLTIEGIPEETQSLALIMEDPDAPRGTFDHWLVFNIIPEITEIIPNYTPEGAVVIPNSAGKLEYMGPCPPPGKPHRYFFKVYALDVMLEPVLISDKPSLLAAMEGHTLGKAELVGLYGKP